MRRTRKNIGSNMSKKSKRLHSVKHLKKCGKKCFLNNRKTLAKKMKIKQNKQNKKNKKTIKHIKLKKTKTVRNKSKKYKTVRKMNGGFGPGACPFVGPSWDVNNNGTWFKFSPNSISPGGTGPPYIGDNSPAPQNGGGFYDLFVRNPYRVLANNSENVINTLKGQRATPSPLPFIQNQQRPSSRNLAPSSI
jgi:hypothetical protein